MILLVAGMINRILGFVPRIMLPRMIGAEGVGLYQMGYPFLIMLLTILTGGIPLAVAKLVTEAQVEGDDRRAHSILKQSLMLMLGLSIIFTAIFILASQWITNYLLTDAMVYYTFLSMSPIIPIVAISSVYRGYFQGKLNMIPTTIFQVVETLARVAAILMLSFFMLPYGVEYAAAGAMVGVMIGELCGMIVLLAHYKNSRLKTKTGNNIGIGTKYNNLRHLLKISIPVTASKLVGSSSYFLVKNDGPGWFVSIFSSPFAGNITGTR